MRAFDSSTYAPFCHMIQDAKLTLYIKIRANSIQGIVAITTVMGDDYVVRLCLKSVPVQMRAAPLFWTNCMGPNNVSARMREFARDHADTDLPKDAFKQGSVKTQGWSRNVSLRAALEGRIATLQGMDVFLFSIAAPEGPDPEFSSSRKGSKDVDSVWRMYSSFAEPQAALAGGQPLYVAKENP
ncbi:hypothetical protein VNO77_23044 [Canavalia gladiata]|uniref:Uncharacterized protein n=1 Tax=Canavalia gladiata TaxID=3824 RepID=A0AAN9QBJ3_CANGL